MFIRFLTMCTWSRPHSVYSPWERQIFKVPTFCWGVYTSWRPHRINCRDQVSHIRSPFTFLPILPPQSCNVLLFNHLVSWHNEQIATSHKLRPPETKQRGSRAAPSLIKKAIWSMFWNYMFVDLFVFFCGGFPPSCAGFMAACLHDKYVRYLGLEE